MKKLVIIDSHALIHRAYHALPPLTSPTGEPVNAVYGFTTILLRILGELKPEFVVCAFDMPGQTFRHTAYDNYKANRPPAPDDLVSQFTKVHEVVEALGIPLYAKEGFEADDLVGTIVEQVKNRKDLETVIVTGDMDTLQLVSPRVTVSTQRKGITDIVFYDEAAVKERYGLTPEQFVDYKGLRGDPSDNIPGVKGIGEKTASDLIQKFGSIAGVYAALKKDTEVFSPSLRAKLEGGTDMAKLSRELSIIDRNVPIQFELEPAQWTPGQEAALIPLFERFGFKSLLKRFKPTESKAKKSRKQEVAEVTASLFSERGVEQVEHAELGTPAEWKEFLAGNTDGRFGLMILNDEIFVVREKDFLIVGIANKLIIQKEVKNFFLKTGGLIIYDSKSLIRFLKLHNTELTEDFFDVLLAAYLVQSFRRDFSLESIVTLELENISPSEPLAAFGHVFAIADSLSKKLKTEGKLWDVFATIEQPLVPILVDMERHGILIDKKLLANLSKKVTREIENVTKKIHQLAGEEFNISSPQQLSGILFEKLGISSAGLRKTPKGRVVSTGASELEKLTDKHPVIEKVLDYRELTKLKSTYIDVLPTLTNKEGRICTVFNQVGASTGRLSSVDPNLQNIPILSETGREVRKAFIAKEGYELVSFDYSQIELRVAAHLANDAKMIEAFQQNMDIHRLTAAQIYKVELDQVTPDLRRAAKTLNFGVLYGMGPVALSESTGMSRREAQDFINAYFENFSGVRDYIESTKRFVEEHGYVETLFGRRRYIPEIHSSNWQLKREAERMAVNMPVQGTATGDIIKLAMIKVDAWIKKHTKNDEVRMLLQVHDELVFEIKKSVIKKLVPEIRRVMEEAVSLKVPLLVEAKAGKNWGEQMTIFN